MAAPPSAIENLMANLARLKESSPLPKGQRAFQARTGVAESTLSRARRGDANLTLAKLMQISNAYRLQETWRLLAANLGMRVQPTIVYDASGIMQKSADSLGRKVPKKIKDDVEELLKAWLALPEHERNAFKDELVAAAVKYRSTEETKENVIPLRAKRPTKRGR